ncbi:MAG: prepilin-type N-terminal cleavage/methylation domain-containing protein [Verrucomicrobiota bacterium]
MKDRSQQIAGFTLVEMMFSLTLGTVILLTAAGLLGSSGDGYGRTSGSVATGREARASLDQLGTDLASAVSMKDAVLATGSGGKIAFLTLLSESAQSDDGHLGDACVVSYRLADLKIGGRTRRCLVRSLRESGDTFRALRAGDSARAFTDKFSIEEPLAFDVVGFESRPKVVALGGVWQDWVADESDAPDALEIKLTLVRPQLAGRMRTQQDWDALAMRSGKSRNPGLETTTATLRFGNHASR